MKIQVCILFFLLSTFLFHPVFIVSGDVTPRENITGWTNGSVVYDDAVNEENWPSMATDSNGTTYVAYQHHESTPHEKEEICVSRSTDAGHTWTLFHMISGSRNLLHPSVAIDPHDNKLYIAYEEEISESQHDIICSFYTSSQGWASVLVDGDTEDDCFPSIASDFGFGPDNFQYISYELIHNRDDVDLKVAKSVDHGGSWNNTWHARYWPVGSFTFLTTMTHITASADGDVFVACIEQDIYPAITLEFVGELKVYYGNRESTSDEFENYVVLANIDSWFKATGSYAYCGASMPSIAASRTDPNILAVVYQTHIGAGWGPASEGMDIRYFYTMDGGENWIWGNLSLAEADEKYPVIDVDNQGGYFRVAYNSDSSILYKQASCLTPWNWTDFLGAVNPVSNGSSTGSRYDRNIALTSVCDGYNSWPIVVWKSGGDLHSSLINRSMGQSLSVSINPLSKLVALGNSVVFTSVVNGGTPDYNCQWYLDGDPVTGATAASWTLTPNTNGIYYVFVKATDVDNNTAQSATARITAGSFPVGGYSVSLTQHNTSMPSSVYLALLMVLSIVFAAARRKKAKRQSYTFPDMIGVSDRSKY